MQKNILFFITISLILFGNTKAQQDQRAVRVINAVKKKLQSMNDLEARFSYKIIMRGKKSFKPIIQNGTLRMKKGNKYRIDLASQTILCDGKTVWTVLKDDEEVNISDYDPEEGFSVQKLFSVFDKKMKVRYDGEKYVSGQKTRLLTFFPLSDKEDYFKILVWISSSNLPVKMEVWNRNGSVVTYELKSVKLNGGLSDGLFVFNKNQYADFEMNDLRD